MKFLRLGVTALVSAVLILVPLAPASAHNSALSSTPAEGSTVTTQPGTFTLTTNDALMQVPESNLMYVVDSAGRYYGDGCATVKGASISTTATLGAAGDYTVQWRVVSTDGHPVSGSWSFHWAPVAGQPVGTSAASAPICGGGNKAVETAVATAVPTSSASASSPWTTLLWFGGAIVVMIAAAGLTFAFLTRKRR